MNEPDKLPEWATGLEADIVEPGSARKLVGWQYKDYPPHEWQNWWQNKVYEWIAYHQQEIEGIDENIKNNIVVLNNNLRQRPIIQQIYNGLSDPDNTRFAIKYLCVSWYQEKQFIVSYRNTNTNKNYLGIGSLSINNNLLTITNVIELPSARIPIRIVKLSKSTFCLISKSNPAATGIYYLRKYEYDGITFNSIGNENQDIYGSGKIEGVGISGNSMVLFRHNVLSGIYYYEFDGADWNLITNKLSPLIALTTGNFDISMLSYEYMCLSMMLNNGTTSFYVYKRVVGTDTFNLVLQKSFELEIILIESISENMFYAVENESSNRYIFELLTGLVGDSVDLVIISESESYNSTGCYSINNTSSDGIFLIKESIVKVLGDDYDLTTIEKNKISWGPKTPAQLIGG